MKHTLKRLLIFSTTTLLVGVLSACGMPKVDPSKPNNGGDTSQNNDSNNSNNQSYEEGYIEIIQTVNGRIEASKLEGKVGERITLTVTPDPGYEIEKVLLNGNILKIKDDGYSFLLNANNNIVEARYKEKERINVIDSLYIEELFVGTHVFDCALEISSSVANNVLEGFKLNIYRHEKLNYTYTFKDEVLNKDETLIFANKNFTFSEDIKNLNVIMLDDDYLTNSYYVELVDLDNNLIDSLGYKIDVDLLEKGSYVRIPDYNKSHGDFRPLDYIRLNNSSPIYFGKVNKEINLEYILDGPRIEESVYGNLPFQDENGATGGYAKVRLAPHGLGDGDTTHFLFPKEAGIPDSYDHRVRYLLINTPEVDHGPGQPAQPYGNEAKEFNNRILRNAKHYIVQSCKGSSLTGTYGRTLGFVWYSNLDNPKISDYKMLNFEIVLAGLAYKSYFNDFDDMKYKEVSYSTYISYAYDYAVDNGLKIHSQKN